MAHDPFSAQPSEPSPNLNGPKPASSSKAFLVLAIIAGSMFVICCGFVGLSVMAVRSYTHPADIVQLEDRQDCFNDDSEAFRSSLSALSQKGGNQNEFVSLTEVERQNPQITNFVKDAIRKLSEGEGVPFDSDMFIEAIDASHYYRGSMGMLDRLMAANWLREYAPLPDTFDDYHRVIGFRKNGERLAEVDLLFYSEYNQPMSVRWFLVNGNSTGSTGANQWQLYDHARLEDGRRMSDEYANYLKGNDLVAEGYDKAIRDGSEIGDQWNWDRPDESIAKLRKCESTRMLSDDRDIALLRFSYVYLEKEQEAEAIRVLKKIRRPGKMWGVWPMMAVCYSRLEKFTEATACLAKAQQQAPGHPRNRWLSAEIHDAMNHEDEAADDRSAALALMPQDSTLSWSVSHKHRAADISVLISAANFCWKQRQEVGSWIAIVDASKEDANYAKEVAKALREGEQSPRGIAEMVSAAAAWADGDTDTAAKIFLLARKDADIDEIKQAAREKHQQCRLAENNFGDLLSESDDIDATLLTIFSWAYDEEFQGSANQLLEDVRRIHDFSDEKLADHPIAVAIQGWAYHQLGQHDSALRHLDRFGQQFKSSSQTDFPDDADWITRFIDTMITSCLMELDRSDEAVTRFKNEPSRIDQIGNWFISHRETEGASKFIDQYKDETKDFMRLQVLKLKALLATSSSNIRQASQNHRLAVQLGEQIEESDETYWSGDLIGEYARDMVLLKVMPKSIESPNLQLCQRVISEAESVDDVDLIQAWADYANEGDDVQPVDRFRIANALGSYHVSQGNYKAAIKSLELPTKVSSLDERGLTYQKKRVGDLKILCQLIDGDFASARETLGKSEEQVGYSSIDVAPIAIADLADWDVTSLQGHLKGLDNENVGSWLVSSPRRRFFEQRNGDPKFDTFLNDYPMPIGYHQPQQFGRLVYSSRQTPAITENVTRSACEIALGTSVSLKKVLTEEPNSAWIVTTDAGDRVLVATGSIALSNLTLSALCLSPNDNGNTNPGKRILSTVTVAVLDDASHADKRTCNIARQLAVAVNPKRQDDRFIAFSLDSIVWTDSRDSDSKDTTKSLADQLTWKGRVPVNFYTRQTYLNSEFDLDIERTKVLKSKQLDEILKKSATSSRIFARHACGDCWERLPVELLSINTETTQATVRLEESSAISCYLRAGKTCTCQISNLRLETP